MKVRENYVLPHPVGSGQKGSSNEGREEKSGDESWRNHGGNEGNKSGNGLDNCDSHAPP